MSTTENGTSDDDESTTYAVVLDYFPHGRSDDNRPQYQKEPLAYALTEESFDLLALTLTDDADINIVDRVAVDPADETAIATVEQIEFDELSSSAVSELEYAIEAIIDDDEGRFVDFYNEAQPITLRLHQLNLLPGIGKKLRNNVIDERKRGPFESFEELSERISGLHRPKEVIAERILEELRDDDLKYKIFVRPE